MTGRLDPWVGKIPWSRKWQPTSRQVFLSGKFHGQKSLESSWDCKELYTTERAHTHTHTQEHRFWVLHNEYRFSLFNAIGVFLQYNVSGFCKHHLKLSEGYFLGDFLLFIEQKSFWKDDIIPHFLCSNFRFSWINFKKGWKLLFSYICWTAYTPTQEPIELCCYGLLNKDMKIWTIGDRTYPWVSSN